MWRSKWPKEKPIWNVEQRTNDNSTEHSKRRMWYCYTCCSLTRPSIISASVLLQYKNENGKKIPIQNAIKWLESAEPDCVAGYCRYCRSCYYFGCLCRQYDCCCCFCRLRVFCGLLRWLWYRLMCLAQSWINYTMARRRNLLRYNAEPSRLAQSQSENKRERYKKHKSNKKQEAKSNIGKKSRNETDYDNSNVVKNKVWFRSCISQKTVFVEIEHICSSPWATHIFVPVYRRCCNNCDRIHFHCCSLFIFTALLSQNLWKIQAQQASHQQKNPIQHRWIEARKSRNNNNIIASHIAEMPNDLVRVCATNSRTHSYCFAPHFFSL